MSKILQFVNLPLELISSPIYEKLLPLKVTSKHISIIINFNSPLIIIAVYIIISICIDWIEVEYILFLTSVTFDVTDIRNISKLTNPRGDMTDCLKEHCITTLPGNVWILSKNRMDLTNYVVILNAILSCFYFSHHE